MSFGAENVRFNKRLLIDVMYLDGKPALHIMDEGTDLSAARFVKEVSTAAIWATILEYWATISTGLPRKILVDQGSPFGNLFASIGALSNVDAQRTGIGSQNSLGPGERYRPPLRNTYCKLCIAYPDRDRQLLLSMSVKAINDTFGPDGLVPSALMFREFPPAFTTSETPHPRTTLDSRAAVADMARREMEKQMAAVRLKRGLRHATPPVADAIFEVGQRVLVWGKRKVENRICEWLGPYVFHGTEPERKFVYVQEVKVGPARPFNVTQVKHYREPEQINYTLFEEPRGSLADFRSPPDCEILLTEILKPKDPRSSTPAMSKAKKKEIANFLKRSTFKVVLREEIPEDADISLGRFVLSQLSRQKTARSNLKLDTELVVIETSSKTTRYTLRKHSSPRPSDSYWLLLRSTVSKFGQQASGRPTCSLPNLYFEISSSKTRYQILTWMLDNACSS